MNGLEFHRSQLIIHAIYILISVSGTTCLAGLITKLLLSLSDLITCIDFFHPVLSEFHVV